MERGARRRGPETPRGVALTGHVPPMHAGVRPPCVDRGARTVLLPGVHMEEPLFSREMPTATDEVPRQMSLPMTELPTETLPAEPNMVPPPEAGTDPSEVKLPPSPAKLGTCPKEVPSVVVPVQPVSLQTLMEQPRQPVPRGSCLIRNWQEERATNHLDAVPEGEPASEGFTYRHGHRRLLVHQPVSQPTYSTTTKDTYRLPRRVLMLGRGLREAMLESTLYQKFRKEFLEKIFPQWVPMESDSTTLQDQQARDYQSRREPTIQPHNYYVDEPYSFWVDKYPGIDGISCKSQRFRRTSVFSSHLTEDLHQFPR
ncbi:sperm-associated antigen 8 [Columba livia]|uniref:sperm-associated antigen 8 n=1 Tax=Columba livia TaxID=8932 RepID=UPI0031B9DC27